MILKLNNQIKQMEKFRATLVRIINQARINPAVAAQRLFKQLQNNYKGQELHYFDKRIETFEGVEALKEYRAYMRSCKPSKSLIMSNTLNKVAQSIAEEKGRCNKSDHEHPKKISEKIMANSGIVQGMIGQLICLKANSSEEISAYFLIDDGSVSRKRRKMLMDSRYEFIGIGSAYHKGYDCITIVILTDNIIEPIIEENSKKKEK